MAIMVVATSMFFLSQLQLRALSRVYASRALVEYVPWVKKEVYSYFLKLPEKYEKPKIEQFEHPVMKMTTRVLEIDTKKSSLKKLSRDLRIVKTEAEWPSRNKTDRLSMVAVVLLSPEKRYEK